MGASGGRLSRRSRNPYSRSSKDIDRSPVKTTSVIVEKLYNELPNVDSLGFALHADDITVVSSMFKYGTCPKLHCTASYREWLRTESVVRQFHGIPPFILKRKLNTLAEFCEKGVITGKRKKRNVLYKRHRFSDRKILLIVRILRILYIKWMKASRIEYPVTNIQFEHLVRSMKLYFQLTVEPYISVGDIVEFMSDFWPHVHDGFLAKVARDYKHLFPEESSAPKAPRTLQHLCRVSVRKSLAKEEVVALSELVEKLFFPKRLKSYLLHKC